MEDNSEPESMGPDRCLHNFILISILYIVLATTAIGGCIMQGKKLKIQAGGNFLFLFI